MNALNPFSHVDLRVRDLELVSPFYEKLLPALGFTQRVEIPGWLQYEAPGPGPAAFFGITAEPNHQPNSNRIAFTAGSREAVDRWAEKLAAWGAGAIEGPEPEGPDYYAVYFEDPEGNRLEICYQQSRF